MTLDSVTRSVFDGLCWRGLISAEWWQWQWQLHCARWRCRVSGHSLAMYDIGVTCTHCDWYALTHPLTEQLNGR